MIAAHPEVGGTTNDALIKCIELCYTCAQVCTSCADACLAEENVQILTQCIRLNLDCADICARPAALPLAAPARTRRSSGGCWIYAPQLAAYVARNASVMLLTMITAGSGYRRAPVVT